MHARGEIARDFFTNQDRPERQAAAERFCQHDDIGLDAVGLRGQILTGAAEAALNLVQNQKRVVFGCQPRRGLHKLGADLKNAALALDRLQDHGASIFAHCFFQIANVIEAHKPEARHQWLEILAVFFLPGSGERSNGPPMKGVVERHHFKFRLADPAAVSAGQLKGCFHRLGSAVAKKSAIHASGLRQLRGQRPLVGMVVEVRAVDDLAGLLPQRLENSRMRVTQGIDSQARYKIQVFFSVNVPQPATLAPVDHHCRPRVILD